MTKNCLRDSTPDSLSGLLFGFEGIRKALVILNGPTGCKFYHSITADNQSLRKDNYDPLEYPEEWYFGQGRVPSTYLDKRDYVYGSEDKINDILDFILSRTTPSLIAVVNSPGAALIGDDLARIVKGGIAKHFAKADAAAKGAAGEGGAAEIPVVTCQSPGFSRDVSEGYARACSIALDALCGKPDGETGGRIPAESKNGPNGDGRPVVNILGLSIYHKYHEGDLGQLKKLLRLCGVRVNTCLLCESTVDEIRAAKDADLNLVIDEDYGLENAKEMQKAYGVPYVRPGAGFPVGFRAMEELLQSAAAALGLSDADLAPALEAIAKARGTAYIHLARMSSLTGLPKGVPFSVHGSDTFRRGDRGRQEGGHHPGRRQYDRVPEGGGPFLQRDRDLASFDRLHRRDPQDAHRPGRHAAFDRADPERPHILNA